MSLTIGEVNFNGGRTTFHVNISSFCSLAKHIEKINASLRCYTAHLHFPLTA